MRAGLPCGGVVSVPFDQNTVRDALLEYIAFVQDFVPSALGWRITDYISPDIRDTLGIPGAVASLRDMIVPESLARIDVLSHNGRPWICDPNFMPLGMAYHAHYARQFGDKQHDVYINRLAAGHGVKGIISTLQYGNVSSHSYLARLVRARGGNFHLFPLEIWDSARAYSAIIRHVREPIDLSRVMRVINPYGVSIYESFVWVAMAQMLGVRTVQEVFAPTILCRISDNKNVCVAVGVNDSGTDVVWKKMSDAKPLLTQALQTVGQLGAGKKRWVIKAAHSSGAKGVTLTGKGWFRQKCGRTGGKIAQEMCQYGHIHAIAIHPVTSKDLWRSAQNKMGSVLFWSAHGSCGFLLI